LASDGNESSVSRPDRYAPVEKGTDNHWMGGWMGSKHGLDDVRKKKNILSFSGIETQIVSP
jgi:hypothetical protein